MMPKLDGYELLRRVKAGQETSRIPVVLIPTARAGEESRAAGFSLGPMTISKPFSRSELLARVRNLLRLHDYERKLGAVNAALEEKVQEQVDALGKTKQIFRYFPPRLLPSLMRDADTATNQTERRLITVFFADLVDFTGLCDEAAPEQVAAILGDFVDGMLALSRTIRERRSSSWAMA